MSFTLSIVTLASALAISASHSDATKKVEVNGIGKKASYTCAADTVVEINGNKHEITLAGPCLSVDVNGNGHQIKIESAQSLKVNGTKQRVSVDTIAALDVNGVDNSVEWSKGAGGKDPKVVTNGLKNKVTKK
jgi:hypothetical protein